MPDMDYIRLHGNTSKNIRKGAHHNTTITTNTCRSLFTIIGKEIWKQLSDVSYNVHNVSDRKV